MDAGLQLATASLSDEERSTLERFVALLDERLDGLISVWLFGSRARGEAPHSESDVDVLVVTADGGRSRDLVYEVLFDAAELEDADPFRFSVHVVDVAWVEDRRRIKSFFIQEVDRDKLVLSGRP